MNTLAPGGAGDVKVALPKNGTTAKVAAKGLGEGPSELAQGAGRKLVAKGGVPTACP